MPADGRWNDLGENKNNPPFFGIAPCRTVILDSDWLLFFSFFVWERIEMKSANRADPHRALNRNCVRPIRRCVATKLFLLGNLKIFALSLFFSANQFAAHDWLIPILFAFAVAAEI